ncbi:MAG: endonuclease domain-containing protein [Syntrophales bacterium]|nr:endonuclease domain-containing protein [Syntrophales bacterium]MDD5643318.1 endonuclease domain-containing protein [Syntrophales bacterium]
MTTQLARVLRKNMTDAESRLWYHLRDRQLGGWKFRRQHPVGPFIVDFICLEKKVVIELDGGQHGENEEVDARRTAYLNKMGYHVLRFWNHEVLQETDAIMDTIFDTLEDLPPHPGPLPPPGGEGVER